jgi:hypothetical protein
LPLLKSAKVKLAPRSDKEMVGNIDGLKSIIQRAKDTGFTNNVIYCRHSLCGSVVGGRSEDSDHRASGQGSINVETGLKKRGGGPPVSSDGHGFVC